MITIGDIELQCPSCGDLFNAYSWNQVECPDCEYMQFYDEEEYEIMEKETGRPGQ